MYAVLSYNLTGNRFYRLRYSNNNKVVVQGEKMCRLQSPEQTWVVPSDAWTSLPVVQDPFLFGLDLVNCRRTINDRASIPFYYNIYNFIFFSFIFYCSRIYSISKSKQIIESPVICQGLTTDKTTSVGHFSCQVDVLGLSHVPWWGPADR